MVLNAEFMMSEFLQSTESPISVKNKMEKKTVNLEIRVQNKSESFREMLRFFLCKMEKKTVNLEIRVLNKSESFKEMLRFFLCPRDDSQEALRFAPVCPSVCPSVRLSIRPFVTLYGIEFV